MYRNFLKRIIDFTLALIGLFFISPVLVLVCLILAINNNGKVFFFQERPGKDGQIFKIIKFKTMNDKTDFSGKLLPDKDRLTILGVFIRRTSLDEIPQLLNVLKGEMSLIGPRPLLPEYLPLYDDIQKKRHNVKPGITGWAQVNGRNAISWEEKFKFDVWYASNLNLLLDLKIIFKTILKVFKRDGITMQGNATTENFKGNNGRNITED